MSTTLEQLPVSLLLVKAVVHTTDELKAVSLELHLIFFFPGIADGTVDEDVAVAVNGNDPEDFW